MGSEISHASVAGGSHIYLIGTNLGSPFNAPHVFIGSVARCDVQPFTSTKNRLHCIVSPHRLPPMSLEHDPKGKEVMLPLRVFQGGRLAQCWHSDGKNKNCWVYFDAAGTPRVDRVLTPVVEGGATVRVAGYGLDGGLTGDPTVYLTLYRGDTPAVGVCGEKGCQASSQSTTAVGCNSRLGSSDADSGVKPSATAFSDYKNFGCQLDNRRGLEMMGGFYRIAVASAGAPHYRGNAGMELSTNRFVDYSDGEPWDAELVPRIERVVPALGSTAGGTDLTVYGSGFGSHTDQLTVHADGAACITSIIDEHALYCRVQPLGTWANAVTGAAELPPVPYGGASEALSPLRSYISERGVRYAGFSTSPRPSVLGASLLQSITASPPPAVPASPSEALLQPSFTLPAEDPYTGEVLTAESWFEAPTDCSVSFLLFHHGHGHGATSVTLDWSGNETTNPTERLASLAQGVIHTGSETGFWAGWATPGASTGPAHSISRKVELVGGKRYWLRLNCNLEGHVMRQYPLPGEVFVHPCSLGMRLHTHNAPAKAAFDLRRLDAVNTGRHTRRCDDITDKQECCKARDSTGDFCVPATTVLVTPPEIVVGPLTRLPHSAMCRSASWVARIVKDDASLVGSCPARSAAGSYGTLKNSPIQPRVKLPREVGCDTITNRLECGRYTDGRDMGAYNGQPCIPAITQFSDGTLCNDAQWVQQIDPSQAATLQQFSDGQLSYPYGQDTVRHQVQQITINQVSPRKMIQVVTFNAVGCEPYYPAAHGGRLPKQS